MDIKDYKINLFDCKNEHKIDNLLISEIIRNAKCR